MVCEHWDVTDYEHAIRVLCVSYMCASFPERKWVCGTVIIWRQELQIRDKN